MHQVITPVSATTKERQRNAVSTAIWTSASRNWCKEILGPHREKPRQDLGRECVGSPLYHDATSTSRIHMQNIANSLLSSRRRQTTVGRTVTCPQQGSLYCHRRAGEKKKTSFLLPRSNHLLTSICLSTESGQPGGRTPDPVQPYQKRHPSSMALHFEYLHLYRSNSMKRTMSKKTIHPNSTANSLR